MSQRLLLTVLGALTFASVYAHVVMAPVLTELADEFGITTGTAGLVVAAYGAPGILVALLVGPFSDRLGRKRFLVGGALVMGLFTLLATLATSFAALLLLRGIAGIGSAVIFPNASATVGDSFPYRERGRAMSTMIAFNTMASVIGIPAAGLIAEATSWRVSVGISGALSVIAGVLLAVLLRPTTVSASESRFFELYRSILRNSSAVAAIVSSFLGSLFWFAWATYVVVFFESVYGLSRGTASTYALTLGLGVLVGSQVGGRLGDRIGHKPIVALSIVASSLLLLVLTTVAMPLAFATGLSLMVAAVIGARFATNQTLMTEQMPSARGTLLALSAATISFAIVMAASLGGLLIDTFGFAAIGIFCLVAGLSSSLIVILFVREEPIDMEIAPV